MVEPWCALDEDRWIDGTYSNFREPHSLEHLALGHRENPCVYGPMLLPFVSWAYIYQVHPTRIFQTFLFVARDRDVASELVFVDVFFACRLWFGLLPISCHQKQRIKQ